MSIFHADRKFERVEDVTPEILKAENVKLLLCDLDNTLRLHSDKSPDAELIDWVKKIKKSGVKIIVISNNGRKKFMQKFCEPLGVECVWWARKPVSTKLTAAREEHGFKTSETVMLGDKWSTDVLAARSAKVRAWQVEHRKDVV